MLILRYIIASFAIYLLFLGTTTYFYFDDVTNNIIKNEKNIRDLEFKNFKQNISASILHNEFSKSKTTLQNITKDNKFKFIKLKYTNHYLTNKSIIIHANTNLDMSWQLNDVTIDARFGTVTPFTNTIYTLSEASMYEFGDDLIIIKSQAENQNTIKNIISGINYSLPQYQSKETNTSKSIYTKLLKKFITIDTKEIIIPLYISNSTYGQITYLYDDNYIYTILSNNLLNFFIYFNILFGLLVLIYLILNYLIMQYTTNKYLKLLNVYTNDILVNNFYKFDSDKLVYKNIKDVSSDITLLSKKMANIINELNVNKNVLDLKVSTDNLTNLPNSKIFELDMKKLFLNKVPSYIVRIKLVCLNSYSDTNASSSIDKLILSFVDKVNRTTNGDNNISLYRLYGSEFYMIIKDTNFDEMNKFLNELSNNIIEIKDQFELSTKIAHMISIPFDHYSNIKDLLTKINDIYKKTINIPKQISFYNQDNKKQTEENSKLLKIVGSIVKNSAFTLSYKYDTYDYKKNQLIMKEVSPNLINYDGSTIAIGTFVSVAAELNIAIEFDKDVIAKAFNFVERNKIDYKLAINISIEAMIDANFITWLESKLLYDYVELKDKIVFSITSFAAKGNFEKFIEFSENIRRFDGQIILKRFNYNDLTLEQLEQLNLNYMRVHSDYTNDITKQKESILRNISDFCLSNDIKLLGDVVSGDKENNLLESISFYGRSK